MNDGTNEADRVGEARKAIGWRRHAEALRDILAGKKPEELDQDVVMSLISHSLLSREDQTKPCRSCGKPTHDFSYWKVAAAGRLLAAVLGEEG